MIIDLHIHLFAEGYLPAAFNMATARKWAYSRMPHKDPNIVFPGIMPGLSDPTAEYLIGDLNDAGIDAAVAMTLDFSYGLGEEQGTPLDKVMEHYGDLQEKYKGRFYAFAGVDPRRPGALELFERAVKEWGLKGFKMYPPAGYYVHDECCQPFYRKCLELGVPVLIHTAWAGYPWKTRFAQPMHIADVQADYPDLPIIFAHVGHADWFDEAVYVAGTSPNSYLELSNWYSDAMKDEAGFIAKLARMREVVGPHRICFGSDHQSGPRFSGPRSSWPKWVAFFKELPEKAQKYGYTFTQEEVDLILGGNAQRLLGL